MSNAAFGSALIEEANNRRQKEKLNKSVKIASDVLTMLDDCKRQIAHLEAWKVICEARLEALREGLFSFDNQESIVYDDPQLNRK
jgi:hypothetical protein